MGPIESKPLADQIIGEVCSLTMGYNEAIKNGTFSEAKEIRDKIKNLIGELKNILAGNEN
jgi:hypothetical protein